MSFYKKIKEKITLIIGIIKKSFLGRKEGKTTMDIVVDCGNSKNENGKENSLKSKPDETFSSNYFSNDSLDLFLPQFKEKENNSSLNNNNNEAFLMFSSDDENQNEVLWFFVNSDLQETKNLKPSSLQNTSPVLNFSFQEKENDNFGVFLGLNEVSEAEETKKIDNTGFNSQFAILDRIIMKYQNLKESLNKKTK